MARSKRSRRASACSTSRNPGPTLGRDTSDERGASTVLDRVELRARQSHEEHDPDFAERPSLGDDFGIEQRNRALEPCIAGRPFDRPGSKGDRLSE